MCRLCVFCVLTLTMLPFAASAQAPALTAGLTSAQVLKLRGQPYYQSEHDARRPSAQEVWLYTKPQIESRVEEKRITDPQTQWPTLYRKTTARSCQVGDVFVILERGVVRRVSPDVSGTAYGRCEIQTTEEFLPLAFDPEKEGKDKARSRTARL